MTTTLGGITLSGNLVLEGIENAPGIAMSSNRTLGGRMVVTMGPPLVGGRTLVLNSEYHLTLAQVTSIKVLEALGQPVTLVHPRGTFTVIIMSVEVEPDSPTVNPDATIWYSGTITMIEV